MLPDGILVLSRVVVDAVLPSKKRTLEATAELLTGDLENPSSEQVFERLLERERLGSTGLAGGVALPHARMPGIDAVRGAFLRLSEAVEFDALDGQPVDLVFALLVPNEATQEHLDLLAQLARMFHDQAFCNTLRAAADPATAFTLLSGAPPHDAT